MIVPTTQAAILVARLVNDAVGGDEPLALPLRYCVECPNLDGVAAQSFGIYQGGVWTWPYMFRHDGYTMGNTAFVDGHVKTLTTDLACTQYHWIDIGAFCSELANMYTYYPLNDPSQDNPNVP